MARAQRRYLCLYGACLAAGLIAIATFNALLDPMGAYPAVHLAKLEPYRGSYLSSRAAKAEMVSRGRCDVLLLGSSRVQVGLPVDNPVYGTHQVCNLGLNGTSLPELSAALEFALAHNHLKRVIFAADFEFFSDVRVTGEDFDNSRFNPHINLVEYHFRNLLGADAIDQSWELAHQAPGGRVAPMAQRGFIPKIIPRHRSQRAIFAVRIRAFLTNPETYGAFHYSPERLELFRAMLQRCQSEGTEVVVFIPPVHALQLETIRLAKLWPAFEQWKRDLTALVATENSTTALWDFSGYSGARAEIVPESDDKSTRMKWYIDSSHFTPELGRILLARVFLAAPTQIPPDDFGVRLTPDNVEIDLNHIDQDRETYAVTQAAEVEWVTQLAKRAMGQRRSKHRHRF